MLNNFRKIILDHTWKTLIVLMFFINNLNTAQALPPLPNGAALNNPQYQQQAENMRQGMQAIQDANKPSSPPPQTLTGSDSRQQYSTFNVKDILTVGSDSPEGKTVGSQDQKYLQSSHPVAAFILQIINLLTLTAASLSFLGVVVGGFMMVSSAGQEGQITKGKEAIKMALLGLVLTLSSYFIVAFVQNLLFESAGK